MRTMSRLFLCLFCLALLLASGCGNVGRATVLANPAEPERKEGEAGYRMVLTIQDVEHAFRWCPPGTFMMGSPESERHRGNETHDQVTLPHGFWILETLVTQEMWKNVMQNNPSAFQGIRVLFKDTRQFPVENMSWNDCQEYIKKLNDLGIAPVGYRFSLPTEAQWEYACRAGKTTPYHFGDTLDKNKANYNNNIGRTTKVGSYPANAWGLYDTHGNLLWEWTSDLNAEGTYRVLKGGSWFNLNECRSAARGQVALSVQEGDFAWGLRLALVRAE